MHQDEQFTALEQNAALVIQATTKMNLNIQLNTEVVDMCKAIRQMMETSK